MRAARAPARRLGEFDGKMLAFRRPGKASGVMPLLAGLPKLQRPV